MSIPSAEIRAVIFDCDGTLVDSEPLSLQLLVEMVAEHGLQIPHDEAVRRWAGGKMAQIIVEIEHQLGGALPDDFVEHFRSLQLVRLADELQPIDGADELLSRVVKPYCVASNAPRDKIELCLTATRLDKYFDASKVFSAYEIDSWKPQPKLFLHAARQLGVTPKHCAVIEDSEFGIAAGLAAGMQVFVYDAHASGSNRADVRVVHKLTDLIGFLT